MRVLQERHCCCMHGLSESALRKKCRDVLFDRGIVGGSMIFHGYRVDKERDVLAWRPHYHALAFIEGGYARCRNCSRKWNCLKGCGGFDDRAWQAFYYIRFGLCLGVSDDASIREVWMGDILSFGVTVAGGWS